MMELFIIAGIVQIFIALAMLGNAEGKEAAKRNKDKKCSHH